jgi:hypothetical protein
MTDGVHADGPRASEFRRGAGIRPLLKAISAMAFWLLLA